MSNKAHRGYGVQGVWGTWAIGHNDTFNLNHLSPHRAIFPVIVEICTPESICAVKETPSTSIVDSLGSPMSLNNGSVL